MLKNKCIITEQAIDTIMRSVLSKTKTGDDVTSVSCGMFEFHFSKENIETHRKEIISLIKEIDKSFLTTEGNFVHNIGYSENVIWTEITLIKYAFAALISAAGYGNIIKRGGRRFFYDVLVIDPLHKDLCTHH